MKTTEQIQRGLLVGGYVYYAGSNVNLEQLPNEQWLLEVAINYDCKDSEHELLPAPFSSFVASHSSQLDRIPTYEDIQSLIDDWVAADKLDLTGYRK